MSGRGLRHDRHRDPGRKPSASPASESDSAAGTPLFLRGAARPEGNSGLQVQRMAREPGTADAAPAQQAAASPVFLVDEASQAVHGGQMSKAEFLSQLHGEVCRAAEEELAGTIWSVVGCPWIDRWFGYYGGQDAAHIERALLRYAPEAAGAASAAGYIPFVVESVRTGIRRWSATGEIEGVPQGIPTTPEEPGALLKPESSGAANPAAGAAVRGGMGGGHPLDGSVRSRMESAFDTDFSGVRIHTDHAAGSTADRLGARAFTYGRDIAFGSGEYQPGTPIGDALLAHELAHVEQQKRAAAPRAGSSSASAALEEDADVSAVGAVASLWGSALDGIADLAQNAMPRLRSGLRLQRCGKSEKEKEQERLANIQYEFMEQKRKEREDAARKQAEEDAKKAGVEPPAVAPEVSITDVFTEDVKEHAFTKKPTDAWTKLPLHEKLFVWPARASAAWDKVVASVQGTELEGNVDGVSYSFQPEKALEKGWYAWQSGKTLGFGMSWVEHAELDPKNVWENLAHEMGGHFEYGTTYAKGIMDVVLDKLPESEKNKLVGTDEARQDFHDTYLYAETEIYSAIRQLRYTEPESGAKPLTGGIHPYRNIEIRLTAIKDLYHPDVAKAILTELKKAIDASSEILDRDKKYFADQVKKHFGYDL